MFSDRIVQFTGPEQTNNVARVDALFSQPRLTSTKFEMQKVTTKTIPGAKFQTVKLMPNLVSIRRCTDKPCSRLVFSSPAPEYDKKSFLNDLLSGPSRKTIPAKVITSATQADVINESTLSTDLPVTSAVDEDDISPYNPYEVCSTFYPPNPRLADAARRGHELLASVVKPEVPISQPIPLPEIYGIVDDRTYSKVISIYEHNQQYLLDVNAPAEHYQYLEHWFLSIVDKPTKTRAWINEQKFKLAHGYSTICRVECREMSQTFTASHFIASLIN